MAKKKSFLEGMDSPALDFISKESVEAVEGKAPQEDTGPAPEGYRINPAYIEAKTLRKQVVLQPSLYKRAKETATRENISFNELVHKALRAYLRTED